MIIKIFQAGNYPQGCWDLERIRRLADAYDPEDGIKAPCVVGDEGGDAAGGELSLGWVRSLSLNEQGEVWADIEASEQLQEWVATRKLGYVSAAIITEDEEDAKKPPRLAHVAFLGHINLQIAATRLPALYEISNSSGGSLSFYSQKIRIKKGFKNTASSNGGDSKEPEGGSKEFVMSNEQEGRINELEKQNQELEARLAEAGKEDEEYAAREAKAAIFGELDELIEAGKAAPSSREAFAKEEGPVDGSSWKATVSKRKGGSILRDTSRLMRSVKDEAQESSVYAGSHLVYARIHQEGGLGGRGSNKIPRRRYLGFKKSWPERLMRAPGVRRLFT